MFNSRVALGMTPHVDPGTRQLLLCRFASQTRLDRAGPRPVDGRCCSRVSSMCALCGSMFGTAILGRLECEGVEGGLQIPRLVLPAAPASQQPPPYLSVPSLGRASSTVANGRPGEPLNLKR